MMNEKTVRLAALNWPTKRIKNKYKPHSSPNSAVPVRLVQNVKSTLFMPSGRTSLSTAPAGGKAKRGKRIKWGMRKRVRLAAKTY
jgi:hypothetical protein